MKKCLVALMVVMSLASSSVSAGETECTINEAGQIVCEENCGISGHCPA